MFPKKLFLNLSTIQPLNKPEPLESTAAYKAWNLIATKIKVWSLRKTQFRHILEIVQLKAGRSSKRDRPSFSAENS